MNGGFKSIICYIFLVRNQILYVYLHPFFYFQGLGSVEESQLTQEDCNKALKNNTSSFPHSIFQSDSSSITDYSPEWAYPEGGVKVLIIGPWDSSTSKYTVLFDSFPVPTSLVQSGVLRCFCPGSLKFELFSLLSKFSD